MFPKEWEHPDGKERLLRAIGKDARQTRADMKRQVRVLVQHTAMWCVIDVNLLQLIESSRQKLRTEDVVHQTIRRMKANVRGDEAVYKRFALFVSHRLVHITKRTCANDPYSDRC